MDVKKIILFIIILLVASCVRVGNKTEERLYSSEKFLINCEVENEYGIINCGQVPLTLSEKNQSKFKRICNVNYSGFNNDDLSCLEKYKNNPVEAYILGRLMFDGDYVSKNINNGISLIDFSASKGYPEALNFLSKYYQTKGDLLKSTYFIEQSAAFENPLAIYSLGYRYSRGIGVYPNKIKAIELLQKSKIYMPSAYHELALISLKDGNVSKFLELSNQARQKKYWYANIDIALLYLGQINNFENYKDVGKAELYINEIVDRNISVGYFLKAQLLVEINPKNNNEICENYRLAYDKGLGLAGVSLGAEYLTGKHCDKNYPKAFTIFSNLVNSSNDEIKILSSTNLAYMYLNGLGVKKDISKARQLYTYSAEKGYQPAADMLKKVE